MQAAFGARYADGDGDGERERVCRRARERRSITLASPNASGGRRRESGSERGHEAPITTVGASVERRPHPTVRRAATTAPRFVGPYVLSSPIAVGGMASIHLGALRRDRSRVFALKRPHARMLGEDDARQMLIDEANIAASVRHPNVVTAYGVETVGDDLVLVMEYVPGLSLADLAPAGAALSPTLAVKLVADALRGLHAAHDAVTTEGEWLRIVHRDVSPQNIHVGVDGVARILDFGIAKASHRHQATKVGILKGKLAYMSPEQVLGRTIDRRSDVYAAAVVLWECLTGRLLFDGTNDGHTVALVLRGCPTRDAPSAHADGIPPELDAIVMRGLAVRPEDRFGSALEMAQALEAVLSASPDPRKIGEWVRSRGAEALAQQALVRRNLEEMRDPACAEVDAAAWVPGAPLPPPRRYAELPPPPPNPTQPRRPSRSRAAVTWLIRGTRGDGKPSRARLIFDALSTLAIVMALMSSIVAVGRPHRSTPAATPSTFTLEQHQPYAEMPGQLPVREPVHLQPRERRGR